MTTTSPYNAPLPDETPLCPSTHWIPLDDLTQRWSTLGASACTSYESTAVGAALTALGHERAALRHVTLAMQEGPSTLRALPLVPLWFASFTDYQTALGALLEAMASWLHAACTLDEQASLLMLPSQEDDDEPPRNPRLLHLFTQEALVQRARLGHLVAEVLDVQARHYQRQVRFQEEAHHAQKGGRL